MKTGAPDGGVRVVKVGGRLVEDAAGVRSFAAALAATRGERIVVVHGGGGEVSALGARLGHEPVFVEGQRVTDEATLRLVSMVLTGEVNKRIVRELVAAGVAAAGLSGEDGATLRATVADEGRLGRVGRIREVRAGLLRALLDAGFTPVLSPVSLGADGDPLNVNADGAAVAVAVALGARGLLFLSDVEAVRDASGRPVAVLDRAEAERLMASGAAAAGMVPKLAAATAAAAAGVPDVRIGGLRALAGDAGTRVVAGALPAAAGAAVPA